MPNDETDPPRKFYGLKPTEFERLNEPAPAAAAGPAGNAAVNPERATPQEAAPAGGVDVRELARLGSAGVPLLGSNTPRPAANDVHAMLAQNLAVADAHGLNAVKPVRKFRRRKRDFWVMLAGGNVLIPVLYLVPNFVAFQVQALASRRVPDLGAYAVFVLSNPPMFVLPLAVMIFYSGLIVWLMFGLMDDY